MIFYTIRIPTETGGILLKDKSGDCHDVCLERDKDNFIINDCPFYSITGTTEICFDKCPT